MRTDKRAVGIIKKDQKILLIHRFKNGREYYVFPGGGVESEETIEEALKRELKEEASIDVEIDKFLFESFNHPIEMGWDARTDHFYLITKFSGEVELGGPEKERMNEENQYYLEWHDISELEDMVNLCPEQERLKVCQVLASA